jgi:predicted Zn finger-like uncharacterized protein
MRLICPNCAAQYEVDDGAIPVSGRDVQCSNCGHAWFQTRAETPAPELAGQAAEAAADSGAEAHPPRRALDEAVMNVLREEAEREMQARREDGTLGIETQTVIDLPPESGPAAAAAGAAAVTVVSTPERDEDRVASTAEAVEDAEEDAEAAKASRRDLLPDIEEINSTLSATTRRVDDDDLPATQEIVAQRGSGFRRGFSVALIIMILLLGTYVLAPNIAARIPATQPALAAYVERVDALRIWLDSAMKSSTEALRGTEQQP